MTSLSLLPRAGHRAELRRLYHLSWDEPSNPSGLKARVDALANELSFFFEDSLERESGDQREVPDRTSSILIEDDQVVQIHVDLPDVAPSELEVFLMSPGAPVQMICLRIVQTSKGSSRSLTHTLTLPHRVSGSQATACFQNGTLRIQCPRKEPREMRIRKIPILPAPLG
ncbi:MAG: HSP20 family molecular chaperone IbpA [Bacteroidia bacterium]|jgi:HSP20 family molecular chaperone IbpA